MLSVYIESFERAIAFQVTSQDAQITNFIKLTGPFVASNEWTIKIENAPELDVRTKTIFLRGSDNSLDKRVDRTWDINSNYNRDIVTSSVDKALNELVHAVASPFLCMPASGIPTSTSDISRKNTANGKTLIRIY